MIRSRTVFATAFSAMLLLACTSGKGAKSPAKTATFTAEAKPGGELALVESAPGGQLIELEMKLSDPAAARICPEDSYLWPGCEAHEPGGYTTVFGADEPLSYSYAPAGVYDIKVRTYEAGKPAKTLMSAHKPGFAVTEDAAVLDLLLSDEGAIGPNLRFELKALPALRPEGDICEHRSVLEGECNTQDQRYRCTAEAGRGGDVRLFEDSFCNKAYLYKSLIEQICDEGLHVQESAFAESFKCEAL